MNRKTRNPSPVVSQVDRRQSDADGPSRSRSNGESGFQFADRRPEAVAQRILQAKADYSSRLALQRGTQETRFKGDSPGQATQFQAMANQVVQRAVDLSTLSSTQSNLYYTVVGGGNSLISQAVAPAPEPKPLYNEVDKTALNGDKLKLWKPRSRFADKKKLNEETPVYSATGQLLTRYFDIEDAVLAEIMLEVETDIDDRRGDRALRLGTAGMNDCKGYATTLKAMIARYGDDPQGLVGKSWLHETRPEAASFPYHGATVVAQDGSDAVTLEAHAGQELTVPMFHIRRGGKTGFEASNKDSYPGQYQDTASESPLMQIEDAETLLETLKEAWQDTGKRSDKSAVMESGPIAPPPERNWILIGTLLVAAIGALVAIHRISQRQ